MQANGYSQPKPKAKPRVERNRVLVTGGAGFVGSHLCAYLVKRGDHVSAFSSATFVPGPCSTWLFAVGNALACAATRTAEGPGIEPPLDLRNKMATSQFAI